MATYPINKIRIIIIDQVGSIHNSGRVLWNMSLGVFLCG